MMITKQILPLLIFVIGCSSGSEIDPCSNDRGNHEYYYKKDLVNCHCYSSLCVRKCCPHGFQYLLNERLCKANKIFEKSLDFYYWNGGRIDLDLGHGLRIGMLNCTPVLHREANSSFTELGTLHLPNGFLSPVDYCINRYENILYYYFCPEEPTTDDEYDETQKELTYVGEIISIPFLLTTFLVYLLLPERNTHRNILIFHSLSLTLYNILFICRWYYGTANYINKFVFLCIITEFLRPYLKSAAYCWMNCLFLDILLAVRGMREVREHPDKKKKYSIALNIYAWGIPGSIFISLYVVYLVFKGIEHHAIGICHSQVVTSVVFEFFSGAVPYLFNVMLFVLIAINVRRARKKDARVTNDSRSNSVVDDQFTLYRNLFFIMASLTFNNFICLMELVLTFTSGEVYNKYLKYCRAINSSAYGIGIFTLYVCRKNTRKAIRERYYQLTGKLEENTNEISP